MTYAMNVLREQLQNAREKLAFIEEVKKPEIDAGRQAQIDVDTAAENVADLERAIELIEAAEHAKLIEVSDE